MRAYQVVAVIWRNRDVDTLPGLGLTGGNTANIAVYCS